MAAATRFSYTLNLSYRLLYVNQVRSSKILFPSGGPTPYLLELRLGERGQRELALAERNAPECWARGKIESFAFSGFSITPSLQYSRRDFEEQTGRTLSGSRSKPGPWVWILYLWGEG
jgi:hypothetical protein